MGPSLRIVSVVGLLLLFAVPASAQSLLVIPDLALAAQPDTALLHRRADASASFLKENPQLSVAEADSLALEKVPPDRSVFDLIGEMGPKLSKQFWGATGSQVLPGSSVGIAAGHAAIYTEIGSVFTGSYRFAVGTSLAVASETDGEAEPEPTTGGSAGLNRFIAGGGGLSLQVLRPLILAQAGEFMRLGLFAVPRVWTNLPALTSADGVDDYGGELALTALLQRHDNENRPFLSLETRVGLVGGSSAFYETVGADDAKRFLYLAPTLTLRIVDQVNIGVSTFLSESFDSPGLRLNLSLLNKEKSATAATGEGKE